MENQYLRPINKTIIAYKIIEVDKNKKGFKFKKAFPTTVEGFSLNYENTDFKIKSITFACQNYEQL